MMHMSSQRLVMFPMLQGACADEKMCPVWIFQVFALIAWNHTRCYNTEPLCMYVLHCLHYSHSFGTHRQLCAGLPERKDILTKLLKDETIAGDIDYELLAEATDGYSGSDLKVCV
jgi:hypothetical protein